MDYQHRVTPGGQPAGPTPVGPPSFRPPVMQARSAACQVIDQIHDAATDVDGIAEGPSGVQSPQPGDNVEDYTVDKAQSAIGSAPPWQADQVMSHRLSRRPRRK